MSIIRRAWKGEASLGLVFWVYGLVLPLLIVFGVAFLIELKTQFTDVLIWGLLGFLIVYLPWIYVSIWRCAKNSTPLWKVVARVWVILCICSIPAKVIPRYVELKRLENTKQALATTSMLGWQQSELNEAYMNSITKDNCIEKTVISLKDCESNDCARTLGGIVGDCVEYSNGSMEDFCMGYQARHLNKFCADANSKYCIVLKEVENILCKNYR